MSRRLASFTGLATKSSIISMAAIVSVFSVPFGSAQGRAGFDDSKFRAQLRALEAEIGQFQGETSRLQGEADTLENKIASLTSQIKTIETQISLNQAKHDRLEIEIVENQQQINRQKDILSDTLGKLYVGSSVSSIEIIAGSKTIAGFMDKQQYQNGIRDKMKSSIDKVKTLKEELASQKQEVERIVADQQSRQIMMDKQKVEQAKLLEETKGEEANYQALIAKRGSQIGAVEQERVAAFEEYERQYQLQLKAEAEERARQEAAAAAAAQEAARQNASRQRSSVPQAAAAPAPAPARSIGNTYPGRWANAPQDSLVDNWGMYNRQCVSYTAWKVAESGAHMPYWGGRGNAYQWRDNAYAAGMNISSTPSVGSVAVWGQEDIGGGYGHVAWVERVNGDGSIYVSQYNWGWSAGYSEMTLPASAARQLDYIRF